MIKFRGKDTHTGEWHYGDFVTISNRFGPQPCIYVDPGDLTIPFSECLYEIDHRTLGQSTELKDMTGEEIYKDDIIEGPHCFGPAGFQVSRGVAVTDQSLMNAYWLIERCEVIGNIHENNELLNVGEKP